ncbi:hypothetical protein PHYPSEUDO_006516 [Phytophthora pseudosyringae]|uniref:Myb/SANT-like domain-containing protein n=1 Tax=Phytophthora pseudosyringae TaxID=221518 RepID=A0A8T1VIF7_9STRA|nr:hypothetical protein PHYPSEUDO_006516 [Phytophthora pseudosyringae]
MVLFLEAETLRLLDLYAALRADVSNVTNNGVLLRQRARELLTASLNRSFPREQPWTESQVSVKFKNLRSEYAEYRWLSTQPGFQADGAGLGEDWWQGVKRLRPKCHAFKGKLPWVFEARMKQIVGGGGPDYAQAKKDTPQPPLRGEEAEDARQKEEAGAEDAAAAAAATAHVETASVDEAVVAPLRHKRKRDGDEQSEDAAQPTCSNSRAGQEQDQGRRATSASNDAAGGYSYGRSLARSVEQSSVAAAGMARGFQDLIAVFQEQTDRCRALEQQRNTEMPSPGLAEQRGVLLAVARSLEQSTRATADMAQGYRELVTAFVRGSDATRLQREC